MNLDLSEIILEISNQFDGQPVRFGRNYLWRGQGGTIGVRMGEDGSFYVSLYRLTAAEEPSGHTVVRWSKDVAWPTQTAKKYRMSADVRFVGATATELSPADLVRIANRPAEPT